MRFEVVEELSEWVVRCDDRELARYPNQEAALQDVGQRLRAANADTPSGLAVRYERKHRAG